MGTLLFVSHDREFLNNLSDITMHMANGTLRVYNGNFDAFLMQKEERFKQIEREKFSLQRQQNHMQTFVDRFRYKATKAKQAQSRIKTIEKLKELESKLDIGTAEKHVHFSMVVEKQSGKIVLNISDASIGYNAIMLNKISLLKILRGQKIAVIGANGIGKSTLLKSIVQEIPWLGGSITIGENVTIGYYSQNQLDILDKNKNVLDNVFSLTPHLTYAQARALLSGLLITKEDIGKRVGVMSGGEKSKVVLASLLGQKNNFLILDEPTNHLDMSSTEALGEALSEYNGTVLFVSHNRTFISSFASDVFVMEKFVARNNARKYERE
jgi:ATP-binding cassette subfamily F protein 3